MGRTLVRFGGVTCSMLLLLGIIYCIWVLMAMYSASHQSAHKELAPHTEGVVVFTGGYGRVERGLDLKEKYTGIPLFISGVNQENSLADVVSPAHISVEAMNASTITLDFATTTRENVRAMAAWAAANNIRHVTVVTSAYHVPRVWLLTRLLAHGVVVDIHPVSSGVTSNKIYGREFAKFLCAAWLS